MASSQEVNQFLDEQLNIARQFGPEIQKEVERQRLEERQIIDKTSSFCPIDSIQNRVIDAEHIRRALESGSDDENVLKAILCMNNILAILPPKSGKSLRIRKYLQNLRQIGGESADGYAMTVDIPNSVRSDGRTIGKELFVLKAPKKSGQARSDLLHEYFIGAFGTNQLRNEIPTFSYIFGVLACSPPYIDNGEYLSEQVIVKPKQNRIAMTYCQNDLDDNQVNYVLYENIKGKSLHDFIVEGCTPSEYLSILVQITFALQLAYQVCRFNHNDLHDENVLVEVHDNPITIPLKYPNGQTKYLRTKVIAKIIDYGRSYIEYQGRHFGYDSVDFGVYPDRSYPMFDLYKLLGFSLLSASYGSKWPDNKDHIPDRNLISKMTNPAVFENCKSLLDFFQPNVAEDILQNDLPRIRSATGYLSDLRPSFYTLPYDERFTRIQPYQFFIDGIMHFCGPLIADYILHQPISQSELYGCSAKGNCRSLEQAISDYTIPESDMIADPYVFYDMINRNDLSRQNLIIQGRPHAVGYVEKLIQDYLETKDQFERLERIISEVSLKSFAPGKLRFDTQFLDIYRKFIDRSVKLVDYYTTMEEILRVKTQIYQTFPDILQRYGPVFNSLNEYHMSKQPFVNHLIELIQEDVRFILTLNPDETKRINPKADYLFTKMPSLIAAIAQF